MRIVRMRQTHMNTYILDTNLFFNMEPGLRMGSTTQEVITSMTALIAAHPDDVFMMPPRIVGELKSFFDEELPEYVESFLSAITIQSPTTGDIQFGADVFYRLIDDVRDRNYRGMRSAEDEIRKAATHMMGREVLPKKALEMTVGEFITSFRNKYRNATRTGFLDSVADLDLIMLAKETDGYVVSTDEGVLEWGRLFGIKELPAPLFEKRFEKKSV